MRKKWFYTVSEKDKFWNRNFYILVIVIVLKKVISKKLEKLNQRGKCLRKYFSSRRK